MSSGGMRITKLGGRWRGEEHFWGFCLALERIITFFASFFSPRKLVQNFLIPNFFFVQVLVFLTALKQIKKDNFCILKS